MGKGRRERVLPLWKETAAALRAWLTIRPRNGYPEVFPNANGRAITRSGFEHILAKHVAPAARVQLLDSQQARYAPLSGQTVRSAILFQG
jgi:integrase/recombinase XerD